MGKRRLRRYSLVVVIATLLLVIAGSMVTSNGAAGAIPDWPLAWGKLIPPMEGGIRFEFAHRVLAAIVSILIFTLALWTRSRLAWIAFAAVVAQALLGGMAVRFALPKGMVLVHACLAQLCFGLVVGVAVSQFLELPVRFRNWSSTPALIAAPVGLFAQTILGAAVRHELVGVMPHIAGAAVATALAMWAGLSILMHHMEDAPLRRASMLLLSLTFSQVFLGMGTYMGRIANADAPQPLPMMVWFSVAHVAVGSLAFAAAVALAMVVYWHEHSLGSELHGGMAVA
jgi:cytochrome c oxidase assembly protein subunit 15